MEPVQSKGIIGNSADVISGSYGTVKNLGKAAVGVGKGMVNLLKKEAAFGDELEKISFDYYKPLMGSIGGAAIGGTLGYNFPDVSSISKKINKKEKERLIKKHRIEQAIASGLSGALAGFYIGDIAHEMDQFRSGFGGFNSGFHDNDHIKHLSVFGVNPSDIDSKKQIDIIRRKFVFANHPDKNQHRLEEAHKMTAKINAAWDSLKKTDWYKGLN